MLDNPVLNERRSDKPKAFRSYADLFSDAEPALTLKAVEAQVDEVRQAMADPANGWSRHEQRSGTRALELLMRRLGRSGE